MTLATTHISPEHSCSITEGELMRITRVDGGRYHVDLPIWDKVKRRATHRKRTFVAESRAHLRLQIAEWERGLSGALFCARSPLSSVLSSVSAIAPSTAHSTGLLGNNLAVSVFTQTEGRAGCPQREAHPDRM